MIQLTQDEIESLIDIACYEAKRNDRQLDPYTINVLGLKMYRKFNEALVVNMLAQLCQVAANTLTRRARDLEPGDKYLLGTWRTVEHIKIGPELVTIWTKESMQPDYLSEDERLAIAPASFDVTNQGIPARGSARSGEQSDAAIVTAGPVDDARLRYPGPETEPESFRRGWKANNAAPLPKISDSTCEHDWHYSHTFGLHYCWKCAIWEDQIVTAPQSTPAAPKLARAQKLKVGWRVKTYATDYPRPFEGVVKAKRKFAEYGTYLEIVDTENKRHEIDCPSDELWIVVDGDK